MRDGKAATSLPTVGPPPRARAKRPPPRACPPRTTHARSCPPPRTRARPQSRTTGASQWAAASRATPRAGLPTGAGARPGARSSGSSRPGRQAAEPKGARRGREVSGRQRRAHVARGGGRPHAHVTPEITSGKGGASPAHVRTGPPGQDDPAVRAHRRGRKIHPPHRGPPTLLPLSLLPRRRAAAPA